MGDVKVAVSRIRAGRWEADITTEGDGSPNLDVLHLEKPLKDVTVSEAGENGTWRVSVPIPSELLCDGIQTFVVRNRLNGARVTHFTIVTGVPLEDDIRAELDLLRAELDMLKKAFRRHCLETQ